MVRFALKDEYSISRNLAPARRGRLLYVVNDPAFFVSHRMILARAAREAGYDVAVVAPPGVGAEKILEEEIRLIPIEMTRWGMNPLQEQRAIRQLRCIYERERPLVVHHVAMKAVVYGSLAAKLAGVPAVVNALCGLGYLFAGNGIRQRIGRTAACGLMRIAFSSLHHRLILQNDDDLKVLVEAGVTTEDKAILVRGSGVNVHEFRPEPRPPGDPVVLFAARMLIEKGTRDFVDAARILAQRGVRARFVMAGAPVPGHPSSVTLETLARWRGSGVVEIWGERSDMPRVISKSSIVCLPSYYGEGVPKVLIEAASCGRPIVTTDTPGCRSIVRDGFNGLLVAPRDPLALADAIERIILDPALARKLGEQGRRKVIEEGYSDREVLTSTLAAYEQLVV